MCKNRDFEECFMWITDNRDTACFSVDSLLKIYSDSVDR